MKEALNGASTGGVVMLVLIGILIIIPALLPGILYIRYFCQESEDRLNKLPWAHMIWVVLATLGCIFAGIKGQWGQIISNSLMLGLNYYFYTVVKRYVASKSVA